MSLQGPHRPLSVGSLKTKTVPVAPPAPVSSPSRRAEAVIYARLSSSHAELNQLRRSMQMELMEANLTVSHQRRSQGFDPHKLFKIKGKRLQKWLLTFA